jgi:hypothetical protein
MIISFAWTSRAVLARFPDGRPAKTKTRRDWNIDYAAQFPANSIHKAYDKNPRVHGRHIADVRILKDPYQQRTGFMTEHDYEDEGLLWMEENGVMVPARNENRHKYPEQSPREFFEDWRSRNQLLYVVEFEVIDFIKRPPVGSAGYVQATRPFMSGSPFTSYRDEDEREWARVGKG